MIPAAGLQLTGTACLAQQEHPVGDGLALVFIQALAVGVA